MILRLFVISYFTLTLFAPGLVQVTGLQFFHGLVVVPAGLYVFGRLLRAARFDEPVVETSATRMVLLYCFVYSGLYFIRATGGAGTALGITTLVLHVLFWHLVYSASPYQNNTRRFFRDLWTGTILAMGAGLLYAQSLTGFQFAPGRVHNLAEQDPLIRSDLDVPFFALVIGVVGATYLWRRSRLRPAFVGPLHLRYPSVSAAAAMVLLCVLTLLIYSRRTPLIALLVAGGVLALPTRWGLRSVYAALAFPLVPLFWDIVTRVLVPLTQNEFVNSLLRRNDLETYLTATNRLGVWLDSILFLSNVRVSHLWGYGGAPPEVLASRPLWNHVHNGFLQLTFDAGFITLALAIAMIITMYRQLRTLVQVGPYRGDALSLFAVAVAWLVMSGVEPTLRAASVGHLFFLLLATTCANLYNETTQSDLGSRYVALRVPRQLGLSVAT